MKIIVQNLAVEYQDEGTGPVVLFLHGWKDTLHTFDSIVNVLKSNYRIIRLDLPGFGKSELPKNDWNLSNYVDLVNDFIKKLDFEVYVAIGHSFGGRVIIKGSFEKNINPEKIILIASAGLAKIRTWRNVVLMILSKIGKIITLLPPFIFWRTELRRRLYRAVGSDYFSAGSLQKIFLNIIKEDLSNLANQIKQPVLLIWGDQDDQTPLADGRRLAGLIPSSHLEVIKGAGHFVHQERSIEVAKLIENFL
jgi:pimeloyl-ACP methyl ester carboxylesterase